MSAERAAAVRTQYLARPGRGVIVVTDLSGLRGPSRGLVELPLRLYWSGPSPVLAERLRYQQIRTLFGQVTLIQVAPKGAEKKTDLFLVTETASGL